MEGGFMEKEKRNYHEMIVSICAIIVVVIELARFIFDYVIK